MRDKPSCEQRQFRANQTLYPRDHARLLPRIFYAPLSRIWELMKEQLC